MLSSSIFLPEKLDSQVKAAVEAVPKLHKAVIQTRTAGSKKRDQHVLWARQLKGEGSMVKKWRVIMRNLPFNVSRPGTFALRTVSLAS